MVPTGHIVREFYSGSAHIRICDDYCKDKSQQEVDTILQRIAKNALCVLTRESAKECI